MWEVIGWIGTALVVISMLQTRITRLRLINLVGCVVTVVYAAALGLFPVLALNVVLALIQVWNLWKLWHTRHDPSVYRAVAVAPDSELVAHFVAQHAEDMQAVFPHFVAPTSGAAGSGAERTPDVGFVVIHGDTLAGLVLARREGDVAVLDVDYVIPTYRDLTPGEFVFHRSGVWDRLGVRRVRSTPDGPDYYEKVGFTPVDGAWELEVE